MARWNHTSAQRLPGRALDHTTWEVCLCFHFQFAPVRVRKLGPIIISLWCQICVGFLFPFDMESPWVVDGLFLLMKCILLSLGIRFIVFKRKHWIAFLGQFLIPCAFFLQVSYCHWGYRGWEENDFKNRSGSHVMNKIYVVGFFHPQKVAFQHFLELRAHPPSCSALRQFNGRKAAWPASHTSLFPRHSCPVAQKLGCFICISIA